MKVKKKILKNIERMPKAMQVNFFDLIQDLKASGPIQKCWSNFSPLDNKKTKFHCHLGYSWVACWKILPDNILELEVYYVGSREKAPY